MTPKQAKKRMEEIKMMILRGRTTWSKADREWIECEKILQREKK